MYHRSYINTSTITIHVQNIAPFVKIYDYSQSHTLPNKLTEYSGARVMEPEGYHYCSQNTWQVAAGPAFETNHCRHSRRVTVQMAQLQEQLYAGMMPENHQEPGPDASQWCSRIYLPPGYMF